MSGELLLAIAYGGAMILVGALAHRIVKRDYAVRSRRDEQE
jgi:hypothetical protein